MRCNRFCNLIFLTLSASLCSAAPTHSATKKQMVKIGLANILAEPGSDASISDGDFFRKGVELGFDEYINQFKKRHIKIQFEDFNYKGNGVDAMRAAREAARSDVSAVIGYNYSDHVFLAAPIQAAAKLPLITPYGTATRISELNQFVFQVPLGNKEQGQILARLISRKVPAGKIAIIVAKDCSYCTDLTAAFRHALPNSKSRVLEFDILRDCTDLPQITKQLLADQSEIKAFLIPDTELASVNIITDLNGKGFKVPYFGGDGWSDYGYRLFKRSIQSDIQALSVTHSDIGVPNPHVRHFLRAWKKKWGGVPYDSAAVAYDSGVFVAKAVSRCPKFDRLSLDKCLGEIKSVRGSLGTFEPASTFHHGQNSAVIMRFSRGRGFVLDSVIHGGRL